MYTLISSILCRTQNSSQNCRNLTINRSTTMNEFTAPSTCKCYWAPSAGASLVPSTIPRRALGPDDVAIDIKFAGICHSDIHQAREEWGPAIFPMVPGHEIGGIVAAVGSNVTKYSVGDTVGVGCLVDSCLTCQPCVDGEEQYCAAGGVYTYNSTYKFPHSPQAGDPTYGGYSTSIVVGEKFVCGIPKNLDLAAAAPLLCAGITTYSPMARFGVKEGMHVAVVGLGGLGHMGVKFAKAFGAHTTVISRGTTKREKAMSELKLDAYIDSTNEADMKAATGSFDFILDCVPAKHDVAALTGLLKVGGELSMVGAAAEPMNIGSFNLIMGRKKVSGSMIGGLSETQRMLDFCGQHGITCDVEIIRGDQINDAYERAIKGDVKYRFVIDTSTF